MYGHNIDWKLFSKIRTGKSYTPSKRTIAANMIFLKSIKFCSSTSNLFWALCNGCHLNSGQ